MLTSTRAVFFLFYFNRLFSTIVSYIIRAYTWHKYHAYIDITSLQFSPLGGRLFFKGVRYHGQNQTILIHDGHVTWRYWLNRVQEADIFKPAPTDENLKSDSASAGNHDKEPDPHSSDASPSESKSKSNTIQKNNHPCRISVRISGVEAFFYNRRFAYDDLLNSFQSFSDRKPFKTETPTANISGENVRDHSREHKQSDEESKYGIDGIQPDSSIKTPFSYLRSLPIQVECRVASAVIGNDSTRSVLITKTERANGRVDATHSNPDDLFRALFLFDLENVTVSLRTNPDYAAKDFTTRNTNAKAGQDMKKTSDRNARLDRIPDCLKKLFKHFHLPRGTRMTSSPNLSAPTEDRSYGSAYRDFRWEGLSRFMENRETQNDYHTSEKEYARVSTIFTCPSIGTKLYWDIPGLLQDTKQANSKVDKPNNAPEYGLDLSVRGGTVTYGPWADRHRAELQSIFFPASYIDLTPAELPTAGQKRICLAMVLNIYICESLTLRIPTRESSKDWKWTKNARSKASSVMHQSKTGKKRATASRAKPRAGTKTPVPRADLRSFGWLDVVVNADTKVRYEMAQIATSAGYSNSLTIDIPYLEVSSSVNNVILLKSKDLSIFCDLSNPLNWKALRDWSFDLSCHNLDLYILRDHIFILTDLLADFANGDSLSFFTFVPYRYNMNLLLRHSRLIMNTNDANVIDDATNHDHNNILMLEVDKIKTVLTIPMTIYRPTIQSIPFDVYAENLSVRLTNPPYVTFHYFLAQKKLTTLKRLSLQGSYSFNSEQSPALTDVVYMKIIGDALDVTLYGIYLRHLINLKENYFGDFIHYRTSQELSGDDDSLSLAAAQANERFTFRRSNDLDVHLDLDINEPNIFIPTRLYSPGNLLRMHASSVNVDLRVSNYFLDLQCDSTPLSLHFLLENVDEMSDGQILIQGLSAQGHMLFGLPPAELTYLSTWTLEVGIIDGYLPLPAIRMINCATKAFSYTLADHENTIPLSQSPSKPDVDLVCCKVSAVRLKVPLTDHAFMISTGEIAVEFDDLNRRTSTIHMQAVIPEINLSFVSKESLLSLGDRLFTVPAPGNSFFRSDLRICLTQEVNPNSRRYEEQQTFLRQQDDRTKRISFFIKDGINPVHSDPMLLGPPAIFLTSIANPLFSDGLSQNKNAIIPRADLQPDYTTKQDLRPQLGNTTKTTSQTDREQNSHTAVSTLR